jgi:hypothetical protein
VPAAGAAGLALLVYLIARLGPERIAAELHHLSSVLPLVLALTAAKYVLQAAGWRLLLRREVRPRWGESISATITGDALGYLTWAGPFTGEPIRALLIRNSVPVAAGIAAGAIERAMYNATAAALVAIVLAVLAGAHDLRLLAALVVLLAVGLLVGAGYRRRRAQGSSRRGPDAIPTPEASPSSHVRAVLDAARELWRDRRGALPVLALVGFSQHGLLVLEAFLLLGVLGGAPSLWTAFVFEAVTKIVNTAGLLVPARLGVSEGGSAVLADALGFAASHGLSLALMRRVRALIWAAVGLALLPRQEARARAARQ